MKPPPRHPGRAALDFIRKSKPQPGNSRRSAFGSVPSSPFSLHARVLLAASVVLAAFLGLTGLVLDNAFRASAEAALRDRLQGHIYALLAAAELDRDDAMRLPADLPEPRFGLVGSGLYAEVMRVDGSQLWHSRSSLGVTIDFGRHPATGERRFQRITTDDGKELLALGLGVSWPDSRGQAQRYSFRVAETLDGYYAEIRRFRRSLWTWLGGVALLLLAVQGIILRWGLAPLRRIATDLESIEAGRRPQLSGPYPSELRGLADNLNALIASSRTHLARYRDALGNLAHSLKTPLAVLRGAIDNPDAPDQLRQIAADQVEHMSRMVEYQLRRAAASGRTALARPVSVAAVVLKVLDAMGKVYADKNIRFDVDVADGLTFFGDEGDLLEILGNLTDNACKWCRRQVVVSARNETPDGAVRPTLLLCVEDDGAGIPDVLAARVLERGERGDLSVPGQGIGLASAQETVRLYGGRIEIGQSRLGGAAVQANL